METLWFWLVAVMLTAYVLLGGFDLGAGALHLFVAKNDAERTQALDAIGPFWDGNEVWLITAGGVTFAAFPKTYAMMFSNLYAPVHHGGFVRLKCINMVKLLHQIRVGNGNNL